MKTFSSNPAFGSIKDQIDGIWKNSLINLQNVHTPEELCYDILSKLKGYCEDFSEKTFATFNIEFVEMLITDFGVKAENIWFFTDCFEKFAFLHLPRYKGVHAMKEDFSSLIGRRNEPMKFDCVIGNPPYQTKSDAANTKTQAIWDKFVNKSFEICKEGGYVSLIHPSGWRGCGSAFEQAKDIKNHQLEYLEIHDEQDGLKTFGVSTRYDWYITKKIESCRDTTIKNQDGEIEQVYLGDCSFIPNNMISKIFSCLAKENEETVKILHSFSAYESRKTWVSKEQSEEFCHPIIYSTPIEAPTIWYSSTNKNGHFGIPKLILNPCRPIGFVIDSTGKYGMSQFCIGIEGDQDYLQMVANVIKNQKTNGFSEFMEACHFTDKIFNKDVISKFRKDFWEEFINEDGTEKV